MQSVRFFIVDLSRATGVKSLVYVGRPSHRERLVVPRETRSDITRQGCRAPGSAISVLGGRDGRNAEHSDPRMHKTLESILALEKARFQPGTGL